MIDKTFSPALYIQIAKDIEKKIIDGVLRGDEKLPSEREQCERYKVSRITVRQAIGIIERKGLVYSVQGKGTYVRPAKIQQNLMKITRFTQTLQERGLQGSTTILSFETNPAEAIRMRMQMQQNAPAAYSMTIVGEGGGIPIVYYHSCFRGDIGEQMCTAAVLMGKEAKTFSTLDLYELIDRPIGSIQQEMFAENASTKISSFLKINRGDAVLRLESVVYDEDGTIMECKAGFYRADIYSFRLTRTV